MFGWYRASNDDCVYGDKGGPALVPQDSMGEVQDGHMEKFTCPAEAWVALDAARRPTSPFAVRSHDRSCCNDFHSSICSASPNMLMGKFFTFTLMKAPIIDLSIL